MSDTKLRTFDVKLYYTGYRIIRVEANNVNNAYDKAVDHCDKGFKAEEVTEFLFTMRRDENEDTLSEVSDFEAPVYEDQVTFDGPTLPGGVLVLDPDDSLINHLIKMEG